MYVSNYSLMLFLCPKFHECQQISPVPSKNKKCNNLWVGAVMKKNAFIGYDIKGTLLGVLGYKELWMVESHRRCVTCKYSLTALQFDSTMLHGP